MPNTHVTKNYLTDNGDELVIGGKLTILESAAVEGLNGGGYTLPVASADTLGGVKVGNGLTMTDSVLSADGITPTAFVADSEAATVENLKNDFNALLTVLREAGLISAAAPVETGES